MIKEKDTLQQKSLSVFKLVMMAVVAIDSLKNLPASAQYGTSILFYYLIAVITFFIPSALIAAELATSLPQTGGAYIWVREAFGRCAAFLTVWIQWIIALTWYPTILSFIAVTLVYLFVPNLAENKLYILLMVLSLFWTALYFISKGIKISSQISMFCAIAGVIIPMLFIIFLGIFWLLSANISQIHFSLSLNNISVFSMDNFRLFITLLYSLMGMEMIAVHAGDVSNPQKDYPKALAISSIIILATVIPSSLAIAIVIPSKEIGLTTGLNDAFIALLNAFNLGWLKPFIIIAIAIGSFGIFYNWLLVPARCLLVAAKDNEFPDFLQRTNQESMPVAQLLTQGIIFTLVCTVFIYMPSVNSAFWLLTAACAQLALIYYLFIFGAALRLRYVKPNMIRPFKVGKHPLILWGICIVAMLTCVIAIGFGFLPPNEIDPDHLFFYETFLFTLMFGSCGIGILIFKLFAMKNLKKLDMKVDCELTIR